MFATERLYYNDSHMKEFDAVVTAVERDDEGRIVVILDRTAFYPTGGGQPSDTGTLGGARVIECIDTEGASLLHVIEAADGNVPEEGTSVRGHIDWTRRLDHMQQHTGQHILSQAFVELFGAETRSFRMMSDDCEIDVDLKAPSDEKIEAAINRANEIIWDDRRVRVHNVTPEQAARMPLRKDSARDGELRVIEIEGFDFSPCGGTHAARTGEVGLIAARYWERAKGLTRVTFVAGGRALADYRRANRTARNVAALFSVGRDEVSESVARLQEESKHLQKRLRAAEELAARAEAREILEAMDGDADAGLKIVMREFEGRDAEGLRRLAFALASHAGTIALLGSSDAGGARLVFARSSDAPCDMGALMREACNALGGRGGGRPDMAQGGGPRVERLANALESALLSVRDNKR